MIAHLWEVLDSALPLLAQLIGSVGQTKTVGHSGSMREVHVRCLGGSSRGLLVILKVCSHRSVVTPSDSIGRQQRPAGVKHGDRVASIVFQPFWVQWSPSRGGKEVRLKAPPQAVVGPESTLLFCYMKTCLAVELHSVQDRAGLEVQSPT